MSKKNKPAEPPVMDALRSFVGLINDCYMMRSAMDRLKESHEKVIPRSKNDVQNIPGWVWLAFVKWTSHYMDSWSKVGQLAPYLKARWGSAQWIDECRGDLFSLAIPFLIDPNWTQAYRNSISKQMVRLKALVKIEEENNDRYFGEYERATAAARKIGKGLIEDGTWMAQEELFAKTSRDVWQKAEEIARELAGDPLALRILGYSIDPRRPEEFHRRLVNIERRTATLHAVAAENKPTDMVIEIERKPLEGNWSLPMPKAEMMSRLKLKPAAFETFSKRHGMNQINRQLWQICFDGMDANTRRIIEHGK